MCFSLNDYKVEISNNQIVLTPIPREIRNYITNEEELLKINFTYATINYCIIHDTCNDNIINIPSNYHFSRCLINLYKIIPTNIILQNTTFNISLKEDFGETKGYKWFSEIGLSVQRKDANGTLKEIMKMIRINKFKIDIGIKLSNGVDIYYKNF